MTHSVPNLSIFGGPVGADGRCALACRAGDLEGVAVVDTGFESVMVSESFAAKLGVQVTFVPGLEIAGIGGSPHLARGVAKFPLLLLATNGNHFRVEGDFVVDVLPHGHDFLIGMAVLKLGVFAVDGLEGAWGWVIDHDRLRQRLDGATIGPVLATQVDPSRLGTGTAEVEPRRVLVSSRS